MKLTIMSNGIGTPDQTTIIQADDSLQQVITTVAAAVVELSHAVSAFARVVERETKAAE